jgi:hypothetical protein
MMYRLSRIGMTKSSGSVLTFCAGELLFPYPLGMANSALDDLRGGRLSGAAVLLMD